MPVLRFKPGRVEEVLGLPLAEALRLVERLKVEAEVAEDGYVEFEVEVDRPDMYSLEGIARQAAGLLGREKGLVRYETVDSGYTIYASRVETRPYIAGAVVWNVNVDEDFLEELIQFQEKLHGSLGSARQRMAIGLHDLDKLPSRKLHYTMERIDEVRFVPLGGGEEMTLRRVLEETSQGRSYGSIALQGDEHPVLRSGDRVISVPPVINAEDTRIEPGTRHIFIDVTGTDLNVVLDALSILASSLAERGGRRIGLVRVVAPWGDLTEPKMEPSSMSLDLGYASKIIGVNLTASDAAEHLLRMRFGVEKVGDTVLNIKVPRYRIDILHQVDLVEEIVLSMGLESLPPKPLSTMMRGRLIPRRAWEREARKLLAGHGFVELMGYTLTSCMPPIYPQGQPVRIANPVGEESACLRSSLARQLIDVAARNQHLLPLRVFELGEVYMVSGGRVVERKRLAMLYMNRKAGYEDIQAVVYSLLRLLGDEVTRVQRFEASDIFIPGRAAWIETRNRVQGVIGEVNPELLESKGIQYPIALAELDYTSLS